MSNLIAKSNGKNSAQNKNYIRISKKYLVKFLRGYLALFFP